MGNLGVGGQLDPSDPTSAFGIPEPRLVKAAHEFEGALMKEMMAPLVPGHDPLFGEDEAGSSSVLGDFAGEALGKAISEMGGFGIANSIIHQLNRHSGSGSNNFRNSPVTARTRVNTVRSAF